MVGAETPPGLARGAESGSNDAPGDNPLFQIKSSWPARRPHYAARNFRPDHARPWSRRDMTVTERRDLGQGYDGTARSAAKNSFALRSARFRRSPGQAGVKPDRRSNGAAAEAEKFPRACGNVVARQSPAVFGPAPFVAGSIHMLYRRVAGWLGSDAGE